MKSSTTVESLEEIELVLKLGLTPITNNRGALVDLGFEPVDPSATTGYESMVWERSIDYGVRAAGSGRHRVMARQRAYLNRGNR